MRYTYENINGKWHIHYDHKPVAHIDNATLALKNVRFVPGGEEIIHVQQILWTMNSNEVFPCVWNVDTAEFLWETDNDDLVLKMIVTGVDDAMQDISVVTFKKPDESGRISIRVSQQLNILNDTKWKGFFTNVDGIHKGIMEYTDPYPMHAVGPSTTFSGYWSGIYVYGQETHTDHWRKRFRKYIYKSKDSKLPIGYPLNHFVAKQSVELDDNGFLGLFDDPLGALVYTMPEGLNKKPNISMCLWGYDLHFSIFYNDIEKIDARWCYLKFKKGETFTANYNIDLLTPKEAKRIENEAIYPEYTEQEKQYLDLPIITNGINRFDKACRADDLFSLPCNYNNGTWRKDIGYDDNYCIELAPNHSLAKLSFNFGAEMFAEPIIKDTKYRAYAMIKRLDKLAKVSMRLRFSVPVYPGYHSLPYDSQVFTATLPEGEEEFTMLEIVGISPKDHALQASLEICVTDGKVLVDNVYFGTDINNKK